MTIVYQNQKKLIKLLNITSVKERSFTSNLTNIFKSGYPDGLGAEVFDYDTLKKMSKNKINKVKKNI